MPDVRLTDITAELKHETKAAYLIFDGGTECWLPKSQVEMYDNGVSKFKQFTLPEWLAKEKGLI